MTKRDRYTVSVELTEATDLKTMRLFVENMYAANKGKGLVVTVAIMKNGKMFDVYDGSWNNNRGE